MRLAALVVLLGTGTALAHPPPDPEIAEDDDAPTTEWSTWVRLGYGTQPVQPPDGVARQVDPPGHPTENTWDAAIGGDFTLPISDAGRVRVGPWIELRADDRARLIGGGELVVMGLPRSIDMFLYKGTGILAVRVGSTTDHGTAQVSYGYSAPWQLWGPWRGSSRYMIGARVVATYTRSHDDAHDWRATVGLEFEPVGAIRYILGIRSWYD